MTRKNKFGQWLITIVAITFASSHLSHAQEPLTQKGDVWTVDYRVLVTGDFTIEPELGTADPTIFYHIKREYIGKATLHFDPKAGSLSATRLVFKDSEIHIRVKINDFINSIYPIICDEFESTEEFWTADVDSMYAGENTQVPALLLIDTKAQSYKTSFPLLYSSPPKTLSELVYKKTRYMNPGRRVKESFPDKKYPLAMHEYPNVRGFIEGNSIRREVPWSELTQHPEGYLTWLSPILHPDKPLFEGVPESKDKVNILIYYAIKKTKTK